ncbi:MAG: hypothetical protein AAGD92_06740 [Pseudomonadota bacterium]
MPNKKAEIEGVSIAEWRHEMNAGNEAFASGDADIAAAHYWRAVSIAEELVRLAEQGLIDPGCAMRATLEARRNLSENYLRLGRIDNAVEALEINFMQFCLRAAWPCMPPPVRRACAGKIAESLSEFVRLLERTHASTAKILSVYAIAEEAQAQSRKLEDAA